MNIKSKQCIYKAQKTIQSNEAGNNFSSVHLNTLPLRCICKSSDFSMHPKFGVDSYKCYIVERTINRL